MLKKNTIVSTLVGCIVWAGAASAAPVQWTVGSGGNDHWYEAISAPGMTWTDAKAAAEAAGGYLATITSGAENAFVFALVPQAGGFPDPYWLGGYQNPSLPEPPFNAGWQWVTGEAWSYTNWAGGEPNNASEDSLAFAFFQPSGVWNDAPTSYTGYGNGGYVVESVPEPSALGLLLAGLLGFGLRRRSSRV